MLERITGSAEETRTLGEHLGRLLHPGDFLALTGDLGSGKTQFVKGIALGLGVESARYIGSPTYTLMNEYHGRCPLYHFDLYRLNGEEDLLDLGFEDYFHGDGVAVVEWAERMGVEMPADRLLIEFSHSGEEERLIRFDPSTAHFETLLRELFTPV